MLPRAGMRVSARPLPIWESWMSAWYMSRGQPGPTTVSAAWRPGICRGQDDHDARDTQDGHERHQGTRPDVIEQSVPGDALGSPDADPGQHERGDEAAACTGSANAAMWFQSEL